MPVYPGAFGPSPLHLAGKARRRRIAKDRFHALDKFVAVGIILKYRLAFNPTDDYVVNETWGI